ncbi:MAG: RimK/LysX family protein [Thermoanaerobaculia bacterium]|nr:RimK/LysX family protein [Thermoanaerobaculia bacterium]
MPSKTPPKSPAKPQRGRPVPAIDSDAGVGQRKIVRDKSRTKKKVPDTRKKKSDSGNQRRPSIGWREWASLPQLGIDKIKVKVDTGARSSALHAFEVEPFEKDGEPWVRFTLHPFQRDATTTMVATARLIDERKVRSSSGKATLRPVIETPIVLGDQVWNIQVTLVRRDLMGFRMLLGRHAVRGRFLVDPGRSFRCGHPQLPAGSVPLHE